MSDELERLKADLEVFMRYDQSIYMDDIKRVLRDKIARLEAEAADPWREAKEAIPVHLESGGHRVKAVAQYAQHLTAKIEAQKKQIDYLHKEYDNRGLQISELVAENDRLEKRVAELEARPCIADEASDFTEAQAEFLSRYKPPFEGPIVGIEPVLDPARVLATAAKILAERGQPGIAKIVCKGFHGAPYKLKRGDK